MAVSVNGLKIISPFDPTANAKPCDDFLPTNLIGRSCWFCGPALKTADEIENNLKIKEIIFSYHRFYKFK